MHGFVDIWKESPFMWMNTLVSIGALAVIFERLFVLIFRYQADSKNIMQNVEKHVLGDDVTAAVNYCNTSKAPLATVLKSGLVKANRGGVAVSMGIEEAVLNVMPKIEKRVGALWSIANIATLIGLIGTIVGLMSSFSGLSVATPEQRAKLLGMGISEALYNTAFGLIIAVLCIFFHLLISGLAKKLLSEIDYFGSRLENLLTLRSEGSGKAA